ncbi:ATP phosphoribosyltransferase [bioreactor metagenome]|uniref:ATP phosphoribosyltransferase n=1 Tax=bioreactor metagenome TaxID=1076179 RepID=A0A645BWR5_9ZZZZ|nr:ATP phosphoribosyltransferase [Oscillospiraceae bacterium]
MIRVALTKGRIEEQAVDLFEKAGYDVSQLRSKGRRLLFTLGDEHVEVVLAKAADVLTYLEHGACDVGIVGEDTIMEYNKPLYELMDLGFGKCHFALAGLKGHNFYEGYEHKKIATKYPNVAKAYFAEKGMNVEIVKIEGSVELAPILKLSDAIVDIVETGKTLRENGLEVYEEIAPVSARLAVNTASIKLKKAEIDSLVSRVSAVVGENK